MSDKRDQHSHYDHRQHVGYTDLLVPDEIDAKAKHKDGACSCKTGKCFIRQDGSGLTRCECQESLDKTHRHRREKAAFAVRVHYVVSPQCTITLRALSGLLRIYASSSSCIISSVTSLKLLIYS